MSASHGLAVRVPPDVDVRAALASAAARFPELRALRLWIEQIPCAHDDPAATARLARELRRAVGPTGRAVVLCHRDGVRDLVLVARRENLGRAGLELAAALLTGRSPAGAFPAVASVATSHRGATRLDWGLGDPRRAGHTGELPLPPLTGCSVETLIAATGLALRRYGGGHFGVLISTPVLEQTGTAEPRPDAESTVDSLLREAETLAPTADDQPAVGLVLTSCPESQSYQPFATPPFPLTLHFAQSPGGTLTGSCAYHQDVLAPEIAAQFARHVHRLATELQRLPGDTPVDTITLLTADEIRAIRRAGATAPVRDPDERTLPELFQAVAAEQPDAVAVTDAERALTYAELDARSGSLAAALGQAGIGPGCFVGVCLAREADLVVTLLGVLKAGAAYVPMDPRHPAERLRHTTQDAGVALVVGDPAHFPPETGVPVRSPSDLVAEPTELKPSTSDSPAYVIYTSGSTGRPKGVLVPHRNVAALLAATEDDLGLGPSDVWTLFHSSAFDFSVWEIWGCLLTGGRLVVVPHWVSRSPEEFHQLLARERVTVLSQTPSAFAGLIAAEENATAELAVRLVVFGGEALPVGLLRPWTRRYPHTRCRLVNMYGITETTVHVTSQTVTPLEVATGSRSVGRALPGWSVSVHGEGGELLPFGVAGEIHVGGAGVADGYLNRPELTAERFRTDPRTGERVYRSGDLGRLRPDGRLEHLGRIDGQVKVRGYRIELGEIRAVLQEDPAVRAAAVVLGGDAAEGAAGVRLDAYLVLERPCPVAEVRGRAARLLPDYMLPATFTVLPALPLTLNGKVDLDRLPAPSAATAPPPAAAEPADLAGRMLAVWRSVLGRDLSAEDDFFEAGGNSLLAVRLFTALREAGLPSAPLRELYLNPTVTEYCNFLNRS